MAKPASSHLSKAKSIHTKGSKPGSRKRPNAGPAPKLNVKALPAAHEKRRKARPVPESSPTLPTTTNGSHGGQVKLQATDPALDLQERLRELVKLAKEQGYLTYDDINEALPDGMVDPDEMEQLLNRLRSMEVDIIDASEVDRYKDGKKDLDEEEEDKDQKLDILDDPVRMYLKQMGQVPLLTREQEVEISKRIEDAELMVQKFINRFGFIAKAHLDLAQKLIEGRERFDRGDSGQENREPGALHEDSAETLLAGRASRH